MNKNFYAENSINEKGSMNKIYCFYIKITEYSDFTFYTSMYIKFESTYEFVKQANECIQKFKRAISGCICSNNFLLLRTGFSRISDVLFHSSNEI